MLPAARPLHTFAAIPLRTEEARRLAIVEWARSQLGITEKNHPEIILKRYRGELGAWCSEFASTALAQTANVPPRFGFKTTWYDILQWARREERTTAAPKPGDLAVYDNHVAIVESVSADGSYVTIGGNEFTDEQPSAVMRTRHEPRGGSCWGPLITFARMVP